jgi:hypothetical protein
MVGMLWIRCVYHGLHALDQRCLIMVGVLWIRCVYHGLHALDQRCLNMVSMLWIRVSYGLEQRSILWLLCFGSELFSYSWHALDKR